MTRLMSYLHILCMAAILSCRVCCALAQTLVYREVKTCENGSLKCYLFDGGYADIGADSLTFRYYVKDHLGSIRIVQNASGTIEQRNNYYPYGNLFGEYNNCDIGSDLQRYKFNGKEHDMVHGLDLLDFGARMYDCKLGRWTQVDSRSEDYYHVSPYVYCLNNPLSYVDLDGNRPIYDPNGNFLGIDDGGLSGPYYIMDKNKFVQGMPHQVACNWRQSKDLSGCYPRCAFSPQGTKPGRGKKASHRLRQCYYLFRRFYSWLYPLRISAMQTKAMLLYTKPLRI